MMLKTISFEEYGELFRSAEEFAVVDTREISQFYSAHLLAGSNLPLSRLEIDAPVHIPHRGTHIVLCDWGTAAAACRVLENLNYTNLSVIKGGLAGWHLAGGRLFPGWNALGKAFGSYICKTRPTPIVTASELSDMMKGQDPPVILDTRTPHEHFEYCIPGSISCPNGETLYRVLGGIKNPDQTIVMHCAGHTRGIMGAQILIDAGLPNKVFSLNLGTLEWAIDGYELEKDSNRVLPVPEDREPARKAAATLIERYGLSVINIGQIKKWQSEADVKTLFVIDVRTKEEYERGTWPGAYQISGGQMLQGVDHQIVTRNARRVLLDTDGVRAASTAVWLEQMGYGEIHICTANLDELCAKPIQAPKSPTNVEDLCTLKQDCDDGRCTIVDIRGGVSFRRAHVAGSWLLGRTNLADDVQRLPGNTELALVTNEPAFADLMAADLNTFGRNITIHGDDFSVWQAAGFELSSGTGNLASEPHDAVYDLEELEVHIRDSHDYIMWRENLYNIIGDDPAAPYMQNQGTIMTLKQEREIAVTKTIEEIREILSQDDTEKGMGKAAIVLAALSKRKELFPREDYAVPTTGISDIVSRLQQDDDGKFALYVNSGIPGQSFRPHDHGESWGIIAAVEGNEIHSIYDRCDDGTDDDNAQLVEREKIELKPGHYIALPAGAIHSIQGVGGDPILHLHLYHLGFHLQEGRTEFDIEKGTAFYIENKHKFDTEQFTFDDCAAKLP